ncbi:hypothetical protein [Lacinutrix sp. 5H-3-7-4]|uniref:hypothetical protein n=1 Tax=Lacinutrix sp. (strain 5H-3-7-4) TaxID=983544 RepID=UPI00020A3CAB|nr:hypothetical protein [Lacinutrix sp. 5H-3-7-4]AEH02795.1 hypothetical protein Lacal_2957 [Lacinutrix sp. 5H-3-7-4]
MSTLKTKIRNVLRSRKINSFLLFLGMAFGILVLTKLSKDYTNTINLEIKAKNLPDEVVLLNDTSKKVNITLTTYGFNWLSYYLRPPKITVDFKKDVIKKNNTYLWTSKKAFSNINKQIGKEIIIQDISPDSLFFNFDVNAVKLVPVKPDVTLNFKLGYDIMDKVKAIPDSVKIIGPESLVSKLHIINTQKLELESVNKPVIQDVALKLDSINPIINIKTKTVTIKADVEKFTEGTIDVPVTLINVPNNTSVNYFPKTIKVSYYTSLSLFKNVKTQDFKIICDFKKIDENSNFLTPKLVSEPSTIKSARLQQQSVEFIISE